MHLALQIAREITRKPLHKTISICTSWLLVKKNTLTVMLHRIKLVLDPRQISSLAKLIQKTVLNVNMALLIPRFTVLHCLLNITTLRRAKSRVSYFQYRVVILLWVYENHSYFRVLARAADHLGLVGNLFNSRCLRCDVIRRVFLSLLWYNKSYPKPWTRPIWQQPTLNSTVLQIQLQPRCSCVSCT